MCFWICDNSQLASCPCPTWQLSVSHCHNLQLNIPSPAPVPSFSVLRLWQEKSRVKWDEGSGWLTQHQAEGSHNWQPHSALVSGNTDLNPQPLVRQEKSSSSDPKSEILKPKLCIYSVRFVNDDASDDSAEIKIQKNNFRTNQNKYVYYFEKVIRVFIFKTIFCQIIVFSLKFYVICILRIFFMILFY